MRLVTSSLLFAFVSILLVISVAGEPRVPKVPAIYVFGDSTADVGNNNYLPGKNAKANFPHYGIDFPESRPTGRFSNGYNGIDFLAIHMGFRRSPPPYLSLTNKTSHQILKGLRGVSFASGGSGILDSTGTTTIIMTKQIEYFATLRSEILTRLDSAKASFLFSKSIFLISSGGNDVFALFSQNQTLNTTGIQLFVNTLVSKYENHVKNLYNMGARKFAISNVPPIGCLPVSRRSSPTGECIDAMNAVSKGVNDAIAALFGKLSSELQGLKYSIGSSYELILSLVANPNAVGLAEVKNACCGGGKFNAESGCTPNSTYCSNRNRFVFWDAVHPTQATSKLVGFAFYNGSPQFAAPINFRQLVEGGY
ncbi:GDSL esterase/lipase At5g55050-like [Typha latifolia]|uniref:GDSL esterase/lipase At5g55050-like n=1 Tax=Typha latifolia TaxID=4733 RepID=UPI003C2FC495